MSDATHESLQRELEHVNEQLRVEHAMMRSWKARALTAEQQLARVQKKSGRAGTMNAPDHPRDIRVAHGWEDLPMAQVADDDC
jgi:hypothetical protein